MNNSFSMNHTLTQEEIENLNKSLKTKEIKSVIKHPSQENSNTR